MAIASCQDFSPPEPVQDPNTEILSSLPQSHQQHRGGASHSDCAWPLFSWTFQIEQQIFSVSKNQDSHLHSVPGNPRSLFEHPARHGPDQDFGVVAKQQFESLTSGVGLRQLSAESRSIAGGLCVLGEGLEIQWNSMGMGVGAPEPSSKPCQKRRSKPPL